MIVDRQVCLLGSGGFAKVFLMEDVATSKRRATGATAGTTDGGAVTSGDTSGDASGDTSGDEVKGREEQLNMGC
eukprot:Skav201724  [mRNA]  locus=scaffold311:599973:600194:- [translate_table: standard]